MGEVSQVERLIIIIEINRVRMKKMREILMKVAKDGVDNDYSNVEEEAAECLAQDDLWNFAQSQVDKGKED